MGHVFDAEITVKDTMGIRASAFLRAIPTAGTPDMTKMLALATSLKSHLNGGIESYSLLDWLETLIVPVFTPATGVNSDKALILYEYEDGAGNVVYGRSILPNPDVLNHFEQVEGEGFRMLAESRDEMTVLFQAASGNTTFRVVVGKLMHQHGRGNRGRRDTCIQFTDSLGKRAYMAIPFASSSGALVSLAEAFDESVFSNSQITRAWYLTKTDAITDPTSGIGLPAEDADQIAFTTVETRAMLKMYYLQDSRKRFMKFMMPSIKNSACERSGDDWRVLNAAGQGVALSLRALFGAGNRDVSYLSCRMRVKDLRLM